MGGKTVLEGEGTTGAERRLAFLAVVLVVGAVFLGVFAAGMTSARLPIEEVLGVCFVGIFLSWGRIGSLPGTSLMDGS